MRTADMMLEHPAIRRVRALGLEPQSHEPLCPFCGRDAETIYFDRDGDCVGCCDCLRAVGYDEIETEDY